MWYNVLMKALLRSPLHGLISQNIMLLSYTGRKSGKTVTLPVNYVRVGETLLATSLRSRSWWRNLRGGAPVVLYLQGKEITAQAEAVEDQAEVSAAFTELFTAASEIARYYHISLDENKRPLPGALDQAAGTRIVVRMRIKE